MRYLIDDSNPISRRTFTLEAALAVLGGAAVTVSGCGGSSSSPSPTPSPTSGDVSGTVAANHGHQATVTRAQITAANALMLDIQAQATHPHTISLTGAQVTQIGNRQQVAVTSSNNAGHDHVVTFN